MNNLKPCPLCGNTNIIIETWSSGGPMFMVKCTNPNCYEDYPRGHDLPRVIEAWNRRANNESNT